MTTFAEAIKVKLQYILPKKLLSRLVGKIASAQLGKFTTFIIKNYMKYYKIDLKEAELQSIEDYKTFNEFFTRALKKKSRPIDTSAKSLISPADGIISEYGKAYTDALIQAKGHYYSLESLLGGDSKDSKKYLNGSFLTIYLSPKNYHRVHMPLDGQLEKMIFVPGDLFSVNPLTANNVDNLFTRNERVVCFFKNKDIGNFAVVMVGATIVASIETVFAGVVAPSNKKEKQITVYNKEKIVLQKGEELGRFLLGSTVVCVFPEDKINFIQELVKCAPVKMGEKLAETNK